MSAGHIEVARSRVPLCADHLRQRCTAPRCQVLARCMAQIIDCDRVADLVPWSLADRLVGWIGAYWMIGVDDWWQSMSPCVDMDDAEARAFIGEKMDAMYKHPLDAIVPRAQRRHMLEATCPVCGDVEPHTKMRPYSHWPGADRTLCAHDGVNWPFVLIVCDWLEQNGAWLYVHSWQLSR